MRDYLSELPEWMRGEISRYLETGYLSSGFMVAVFSNNLFDAYANGDEYSIAALPALIKHIYNHMPLSCHGSGEAIRDFREQIQKKKLEV